MGVFQPGDLIFFWGTGFSSRVIEWVTRGPSHVGICCDSIFHDAFLLAESTSLCPRPDVISGEMVEGVQFQRPDQRIADYGDRAVVMRLREIWELESAEVSELDYLVNVFHGKPYDLGGALRSGTRLFKWTSLMPYPDLGHLFCSEFCAELLMRLGRLPIDDPARYNPANLLRAVKRCGTFYEVPLPLTEAR